MRLLVVGFDGHVKDSGQTVADMPMGFCFFVVLTPSHNSCKSWSSSWSAQRWLKPLAYESLCLSCRSCKCHNLMR